MATQQDVDYINDCQRRVTAETGILETKATVTVPAGSVSVSLPTAALQLLAVYDAATQLPSISPLEYLRVSTGAAYRGSANPWCVIGRTLYLAAPAPQDHTLTLIYLARSQGYTSATELEVTGEYERLVERLVGACILLDDGQPELAATEFSQYDRDVLRLRLRSSRGHGPPKRMSIRGRSV